MAVKKYLDVKGCSVIDEGGNIRGIVEDCIMDLKKLKIYSFIVMPQNVFSSPGLLSLKYISQYGDVIVSKSDIYKINKLIVKKNKKMMLQNFIGREVIDLEGKRIGNLIDLVFDEKSGEVKALICRKGFFEDILEGRRLVIVDEKTIFGGEKIIADNGNFDIINYISFKKFTRG